MPNPAKKVTCRRGGTSYTDLALSRALLGLCFAAKTKGGAALTRRCLDSTETKKGNLNEKWQANFIIINIIIMVLRKFAKEKEYIKKDNTVSPSSSNYNQFSFVLKTDMILKFGLNIIFFFSVQRNGDLE